MARSIRAANGVIDSSSSLPHQGTPASIRRWWSDCPPTVGAGTSGGGELRGVHAEVDEQGAGVARGDEHVEAVFAALAGADEHHLEPLAVEGARAPARQFRAVVAEGGTDRERGELTLEGEEGELFA